MGICTLLRFIVVVAFSLLASWEIWEIHVFSFTDTGVNYDSSIINVYTQSCKWSKGSGSWVFWGIFQREWGGWMKSCGSKSADCRYTDDLGWRDENMFNLWVLT